MRKLRLISVAIASFAFLPSTEAAIVFSYSVTSSDLPGSGSAAGKILAGAQEIGDWTLSGFSRTFSAGTPSTPTISAFTAAQNLPYSYNLPGLGIIMGGTNFQITGFAYSISASIDPLYSANYQIEGVTIFGRNPAIGAFTGPNNATSWPAGSLTFSNFTGTATVSDPNNNLAIADGATFVTATNIGGYLQGPTTDWSPATLQWKVTTDAGSDMSYTANYSPWRGASEGTAFGFNVVALPQPVPEPGTWAAAALLAGTAGFMRWRKRAKSL